MQGEEYFNGVLEALQHSTSALSGVTVVQFLSPFRNTRLFFTSIGLISLNHSVPARRCIADCSCACPPRNIFHGMWQQAADATMLHATIVLVLDGKLMILIAEDASIAALTLIGNRCLAVWVALIRRQEGCGSLVLMVSQQRLTT